MLKFNEFLSRMSEASGGNPKLVLVLGGQGGGKSWVAQQFVQHGFNYVALDNFLIDMLRPEQGGGKIYVDLKNPTHKQYYLTAAGQVDDKVEQLMSKGQPIVTEKTGQNYGTVAATKSRAESNGYDVFCVYVESDVEAALKANRERTDRTIGKPGSENDPQAEEELRRAHEKIRGNMFPSKFGTGFQGLFGNDRFFHVRNDRSPETNAQIEQVVSKIVHSPVSAQASLKWKVHNMTAHESRLYMPRRPVNMSFREHFEYYHETATANFNEPGVVKVLDNPQEEGSMLVYNIRSTLEPGKKIMLVIPEQYRNLVIRDMVLSHRKGPHGHGEPNMKWEPAKNKWRDYYGAYTRIEAHNTQDGTWHTYVDDYGASFKFAEHRPSDWEEETLHDWIRIAKVKPDVIRLTNPGNQRASTNPLTGEKVDPMDQRSTSEIAYLKVIFFPDVDLDAEMQSYERIYSKSGGPSDATTRFAKYNSANAHEKEPSYGNYGAGIYPNALVLAADWSRQGKRIRQQDGGHWFIVSKEHFDQVAGELGDRARASGGTYNYKGREFVKVFPVTLDGGPGTQVQGNQLMIDIPAQLQGRKLAQVEVMCGDTEFRPDGPERDKPWKRLGYARLKIGVQSKTYGQMWFNGEGVSVAPQMVASAAPKQPIQLQTGDKVVLRSEQDTTYVMGWRILYQ